MKYPHIAKTVLLLLTMSGLSACTSLNSKVGTYFDMDTDLQVDFLVEPDINPDEKGKASPLFVRMYELKSPKMMSRADFVGVYENDKEALGEDFVAVHRLQRFRPGESRTEHYVLDKETRYVAFFAEFLKYKDAKYKVLLPVVANNVVRTSAIARMTGNEVLIETR